MAQQHVRAAGPRRRPGRRPRRAVCDRLRPVLPLLLAISANSPYVDGRDSRPAHRPHADLHQVVPALRRARTRSAAGRRGATTSTSSCARARSSSTRSCGGRCGRTTRSAPSRCASATRRRTAAESDGAGRADRRLRRAGAARDRRGRAAADLPGAADRGEHVAGDPPRAGRPAARPRGRAARSTRAAEALDRLQGLDRRATSIAARAQRRPAPAAPDRRRRRARGGVRGSACARPARRTPGGDRHEHSRLQPPKRRCAPLEAEIEQLTVDDVLLQTVVTLINLGARKAGLAPGHRGRALTSRRCAGDRRRARAAAARRAAPRRAARPGPRRALAAADGLPQLRGGRRGRRRDAGGGDEGRPEDPAQTRGTRPGAELRAPLGAGPVARDALPSRSASYWPRSSGGLSAAALRVCQ